MVKPQLGSTIDTTTPKSSMMLGGNTIIGSSGAIINPHSPKNSGGTVLS
jgi:hypothetical protein